MRQPNCPFYGRVATFTRLGTGGTPQLRLDFLPAPGDLCALMIEPPSDCPMKVVGIDWTRCRVSRHLALPMDDEHGDRP
jgi:hypothetical protein